MNHNKDCKLSDCKQCPLKERKLGIGVVKCPMYEELVADSKKGAK